LRKSILIPGALGVLIGVGLGATAVWLFLRPVAAVSGSTDPSAHRLEPDPVVQAFDYAAFIERISGKRSGDFVANYFKAQKDREWVWAVWEAEPQDDQVLLITVESAIKDAISKGGGKRATEEFTRLESAATNTQSHKQHWLSMGYSVEIDGKTQYRRVDVFVTAPIQGKQWSAGIRLGK
jgi:hypothetical protein